MIKVQNLAKVFGAKRAVDDISFSVERGEVLGFLGPNGAGKSTLINTLLGFYKSCAGSARVFGYDVGTEIGKIRGVVGYMPENDAFISKMSAVSFVQMLSLIHISLLSARGGMAFLRGHGTNCRAARRSR